MKDKMQSIVAVDQPQDAEIVQRANTPLVK